LVLGHLLAYALAYPEEEARRSHLAATGHGWLDLVGLSLLAVIPAMLLLTTSGAIRGGPVVAGWSRLAALQVPAFLLIELAERGSAIGGAFSDPAVLLGIVLQLVVAGVAALLLRGFSVLMASVARRRHTRERTESAPFPALPPLTSPHLVRLVRSRRRAPPLPTAV
jgi:hypothetical protein